MCATARTDDPAFGPLVWDGFQHGGWGGSFASPNFSGWGTTVEALVPDQNDEGEDEPETPAQDFLSTLLAVGGAELEKNPEARKIIEAARTFAAERDVYDGSLDAAPLRKAGRLKVVIPNSRDQKPTAQQRKAWKTFLSSGVDIAEQVAAALLKTYQQQRPERLRWWHAMYKESPDTLLPEVSDTQTMRGIIRPTEFAVPARPDGETFIAIVFECLWAKEEILVRVCDGRVASVGPLVEDPPSNKWAQFTRAKTEEFESPVFGRLRRGRVLGGWSGVFHSEHLRGFDDASQMRYRYKTDRQLRSSVYRPAPPWETIAGEFGLQVQTEGDDRPTPEQEEAFRAFNADPSATAQQVLSAIFAWYQENRPKWVRPSRKKDPDTESVFPILKSPEGLLEMIQLQSVAVLPCEEHRPASGPREMMMTVGPKAGKKIIGPPVKERPAGVPIILSFHWEDEHGLAVRWRNGKVEEVGDWDSIADA